MIYIKEAHPSDGRQVQANRRDGMIIKDHDSMESRIAAATKLKTDLKLMLPIFADSMEGEAERRYSAWPDRIFIIGTDKKIAYRGAQGPRGFNVSEAEQTLQNLLAKKSRDSRTFVAQ